MTQEPLTEDVTARDEPSEFRVLSSSVWYIFVMALVVTAALFYILYIYILRTAVPVCTLNIVSPNTAGVTCSTFPPNWLQLILLCVMSLFPIVYSSIRLGQYLENQKLLKFVRDRLTKDDEGYVTTKIVKNSKGNEVIVDDSEYGLKDVY